MQLCGLRVRAHGLFGAAVLAISYAPALVDAAESALASRRAVAGAGGCEEAWEYWAGKNDACYENATKLEADIKVEYSKLMERIERNKEILGNLNDKWQSDYEAFRKDNEYLAPETFLQTHSGGARKGRRGRLLAAARRTAATRGAVRYLSEPVPKCQCVLDDKCECLPNCQLLVQHCHAHMEQVRQWGTKGYYHRLGVAQAQEARIEAIPELRRRLQEANPNA